MGSISPAQLDDEEADNDKMSSSSSHRLSIDGVMIGCGKGQWGSSVTSTIQWGLLPSHQRQLLAPDAGRWLLNAISCLVQSSAIKAVVVWVCIVVRPGQDRFSQGSSRSNCMHEDQHVKWATRWSLKWSKMPGSRSCHLLQYILGWAMYLGSHVLATWQWGATCFF